MVLVMVRGSKTLGRGWLVVKSSQAPNTNTLHPHIQSVEEFSQRISQHPHLQTLDRVRVVGDGVVDD